RRLPGAGVADQRDEALARLDPVAEGGQRLLVAVVEVEEAWVGGDVEGGFAKPEVLGVHGGKAAGGASATPREAQRPRRSGARAIVHTCKIMQGPSRGCWSGGIGSAQGAKRPSTGRAPR